MRERLWRYHVLIWVRVMLLLWRLRPNGVRHFALQEGEE